MSDIVTLVTSLTSLFETSIVPLIILIVGFFVGIRWVKRAR